MIYWQQSNFTKNTRFIKKKNWVFLFSFWTGNIERMLAQTPNIIWYTKYSPSNVLLSHFSVRSPSALNALTVRSLALSASLALTVHKALTERSQSVDLALTVCLAFTYFQSLFYSFSFETPKWKGRSLRIPTIEKENTCVKVEGNLYITSAT